MGNERLRALISKHGFTTTDIADHVQVDPKTVERWIQTGRTPHRRHRSAVSAMLRSDEAYLWPDAFSEKQAVSASGAELVRLYPNRGAVSVATWLDLLGAANESVDLLAYGGSFLHDSLPGFGEKLADLAKAGVKVRLLFGDPDAPSVEQRGEEEGIGDLLGARCRLTWAYFEQLLDAPGIEARKHGTTLYNSIYRFDDTAMINAHTLGAPASQSPVLHLQRVTGGRLFDHYMTSFDRVWKNACDLS